MDGRAGMSVLEHPSHQGPSFHITDAFPHVPALGGGFGFVMTVEMMRSARWSPVRWASSAWSALRTKIVGECELAGSEADGVAMLGFCVESAELVDDKGRS